MTVARVLLAHFVDPPEAEMPMLPFDGGEPRTPWQSRWSFKRDSKWIRVAVRIRHPGGELELTDARSFIERLADFPKRTTFQILVDVREGEPTG